MENNTIANILLILSAVCYLSAIIILLYILGISAEELHTTHFSWEYILCFLISLLFGRVFIEGANILSEDEGSWFWQIHKFFTGK